MERGYGGYGGRGEETGERQNIKVEESKRGSGRCRRKVRERKMQKKGKKKEDAEER